MEIIVLPTSRVSRQTQRDIARLREAGVRLRQSMPTPATPPERSRPAVAGALLEQCAPRIYGDRHATLRRQVMNDFAALPRATPRGSAPTEIHVRENDFVSSAVMTEVISPMMQTPGVKTYVDGVEVAVPPSAGMSRDPPWDESIPLADMQPMMRTREQRVFHNLVAQLCMPTIRDSARLIRTPIYFSDAFLRACAPLLYGESHRKIVQRMVVYYRTTSKRSSSVAEPGVRA